MPISETRAIIDCILGDGLNRVKTHADPIFGLRVPKAIPGVETTRLNPRDTWKDPTAYDEKAQFLAMQFKENFKKFADRVPVAVRGCGPV